MDSLSEYMFLQDALTKAQKVLFLYDLDIRQKSVAHADLKEQVTKAEAILETCNEHVRVLKRAPVVSLDAYRQAIRELDQAREYLNDRRLAVPRRAQAVARLAAERPQLEKQIINIQKQLLKFGKLLQFPNVPSRDSTSN